MMLFSINEDGDLDIDNGKYFSDFVMSDKIETDYRISRTLLLTHFFLIQKSENLFKKK